MYTDSPTEMTTAITDVILAAQSAAAIYVIRRKTVARPMWTQVWAWVGRYSAREHVAVDIGALYWYAAVAFWLVLAGTVYVGPYVI